MELLGIAFDLWLHEKITDSLKVLWAEEVWQPLSQTQESTYSVIPFTWILEQAIPIYGDRKQINGCLGFGRGRVGTPFEKMEMFHILIGMVAACQNSWNLSYA